MAGAIRMERTDSTDLALARGLDINTCCNADGHTLLHSTISAKRPSMAKHLLVRGANPDTASEDSGVTLLALACSMLAGEGIWGFVESLRECVNILISAHASPNLGSTLPLEVAISKERLELIPKLVKAGARVDLLQPESKARLEGFYAMNFACCTDDLSGPAKRLLGHVHDAIVRGDLRRLEDWMETLTWLNIPPLVFAAAHRRLWVCTLLRDAAYCENGRSSAFFLIKAILST
jgi:hypothetical protein